MAARWEDFEKDGDDYFLQYRTAGDNKVRPTHAALHGVTLPPSDSFWNDFYPPNGWNCRCSVVQVRRSKHHATDHTEAIARGEQATANDTRHMFRFNPGILKKTFPPYNPYTIPRCASCDKSHLSLVAPDNEICVVCEKLQSLVNEEEHRRLSKAERIKAGELAKEWADKHLPKVILANNVVSYRLYASLDNGDTLIIGKKFFSETY